MLKSQLRRKDMLGLFAEQLLEFGEQKERKRENLSVQSENLSGIMLGGCCFEGR
jgi:hypothetical protein